VEKEKETKNEKVDVLRSIAEQFGKVKKSLGHRARRRQPIHRCLQPVPGIFQLSSLTG